VKDWTRHPLTLIAVRVLVYLVGGLVFGWLMGKEVGAILRELRP
jgi:hypothetical protein